MLVNAIGKTFLAPLMHQGPLTNSRSFLVRNLTCCINKNQSKTDTGVENVLTARSQVDSVENLSKNISTNGTARDKITDYLSSKSVWDDDPTCDRTPYCESKRRPQRMDEVEEKLKGPKKYKKLANYFPELNKRNQALSSIDKKKFSTSAALRGTKYRIPGIKPRRRGAPLTPEELITIRDNEFYKMRKQLEGVYSEHEKEKPQNPKCPSIRGRMKCCQQQYREDCGVVGRPVICMKTECPYPCFVDCKELDPEPPFSECLVCPVERATLRAKYLAKKCEM